MLLVPMVIMPFLLSIGTTSPPRYFISSLSESFASKSFKAALSSDLPVPSSSRNLSVVYVPTAYAYVSVSSQSSPGRQRQRHRARSRKTAESIRLALEDLGHTDPSVQELWLEDGKGEACLNDVDENVKEDEKKVDLVLVDGGNTYHLYKSYAQSPVRARFLEALKECVFVGISAGAIIAGRKVSTAGIKGWDDEAEAGEVPWDWEEVEGMSLSSLSFLPHYEEKWEEAAGAWEAREGQEVVKIREEGAWREQGGSGAFL